MSELCILMKQSNLWCQSQTFTGQKGNEYVPLVCACVRAHTFDVSLAVCAVVTNGKLESRLTNADVIRHRQIGRKHLAIFDITTCLLERRLLSTQPT